MPLTILWKMPLKIHVDFCSVDFWCAIFCPYLWIRGFADSWTQRILGQAAKGGFIIKGGRLYLPFITVTIIVTIIIKHEKNNTIDTITITITLAAPGWPARRGGRGRGGLGMRSRPPPSPLEI